MSKCRNIHNPQYYETYQSFLVSEFPTSQFRTMAAAPGLEEQSALEKTAKERQILFVQFGIEQFNNALDVYR